MIKNPTPDLGKINITLKDGTEYLGKDVPEHCFGQNDRFVAFWDDNSLVFIPFSEVKKVALYAE
jgi:hypothetical protein